jgi:hypothetical protein
MKSIKIECPSCQQPIEINPPDEKPRGQRPLIIVILAIAAIAAIIAAWPISYDYDEIILDPSANVTNHWLIAVNDPRRETNEVAGLAGPLGALAAAGRYGWVPVSVINTNQAIVRRARLPWRNGYFYILNDREGVGSEHVNILSVAPRPLCPPANTAMILPHRAQRAHRQEPKEGIFLCDLCDLIRFPQLFNRRRGEPEGSAPRSRR